MGYQWDINGISMGYELDMNIMGYIGDSLGYVDYLIIYG